MIENRAEYLREKFIQLKIGDTLKIPILEWGIKTPPNSYLSAVSYAIKQDNKNLNYLRTKVIKARYFEYSRDSKNYIIKRVATKPKTKALFYPLEKRKNKECGICFMETPNDLQSQWENVMVCMDCFMDLQEKKKDTPTS